MISDIRGVVVSGIGEGSAFMDLEWVKRQILEKLGFEPYVGTLNLKLDEETSGRFQSYITSRRGILIEPEDEKLRAGKCFRVRVERKIEGAVIVPLVANYPEDQVEELEAITIPRIPAWGHGRSLSRACSMSSGRTFVRTLRRSGSVCLQAAR